MHYLKKVASSMYEKVLEEQYLTPLTFQEVYSLLQKTHIRKKSLHEIQTDKDGRIVDKAIWETIDKFASITP